jgi:hypothetical protein
LTEHLVHLRIVDDAGDVATLLAYDLHECAEDGPGGEHRGGDPNAARRRADALCDPVRQLLAVPGAEPRPHAGPVDVHGTRLDPARRGHVAAVPEVLEVELVRVREQGCVDSDDHVLLPGPRVVGPVGRSRPHRLGVADGVLVVHQVRNPWNAERRQRQRLERVRNRFRGRWDGDRPRVVDVVEEPDGDAALVGGQQGCEDERRGAGFDPHVVQS